MKYNVIFKKSLFSFMIFSLFLCMVRFVYINPVIHSAEATFKVQARNGFYRFSALPFSSAKKEKANTQFFLKKEEKVPEKKYNNYIAEPSLVAGELQIKNDTAYNPNIKSLLAKPFSITKGNPTVLILHTHTSEAYAKSEAYNYTESDPYRTEDPERNICLVGEKLCNVLNQNGIKAVHDKKSHDFPSYSGSYSRSLQTALFYDEAEIIIDLHRDAISDENGQYLKTSANINGLEMAQAEIIVGTDASGLAHENWEENLSFALKVQNEMCKLYPGLARPLQLRTERFNGHAAKGAILIEIGSNANTMEEALSCAELVGNALSKTILAL